MAFLSYSLMKFRSLSALLFAISGFQATHAFDNTRFDNGWPFLYYPIYGFTDVPFHFTPRSSLCMSGIHSISSEYEFSYCSRPHSSYWGQNSYGATHPDDVANFQQRLSFYCGSDSVIDAFPVAFLNVFFGTGGLPSINLANVR